MAVVKLRLLNNLTYLLT